MQGRISHHFREYAAETPDVHGHGVTFGTQEDFGSAVPEGDHLVGVVANGYGEGSGQAEVCQLYDSVIIEQKVLRLQVSMEYTM